MDGRDDHTISIILADNQQVSRIGMRALVEDVSYISIIAEADSGREALTLVQEYTPDVLMSEMALGDISGIQIATELSDAAPDVPLLAFSAYNDRNYIRHVLENGIAGYVMKQDSPAFVLEAIRAVARGEVDWMSPCVARKARKLAREDLERDDPELAPSEWEVLTLLTRGFKADEIAAEIHRSKSTVRGRLTAIYEKLEVEDRYGAIVWGIRHGLLEDQVG